MRKRLIGILVAVSLVLPGVGAVSADCGSLCQPAPEPACL